MRTKRLILALVAIGAIACTKDPKPETKPAPVVSVAPSASAKTTEALAFSLLATSPWHHVVGAAPDAALVASGPLLYLLTPDGKLAQDPLLLKGLRGPANRAVGYFGAWPDVWAATSDPSEQAGAPSTQRVLHHANDQWNLVPSGGPSVNITAIIPWKEGRRLAVVEEQGSFPWWSFRLVAGKTPVVLPAPATNGPMTDSGLGCQDPLVPDTAVGFESGEVFVAGRVCDAAPGSVGDHIERWEPPKMVSVTDNLDGVVGRVQVVAGASPKQVWAVRGPKNPALFHYNGYSFQAVPLPEGEKAVNLVALGFDGDKVTLAVNTHLYARSEAEAWVPLPIALPLPEGLKQPVIAHVDYVGGQPFVLVMDLGGPRHAWLYGTKAPAPVIELLDADAEKKAALGGGAAFDVASDACTSIVVPLQANASAKQKFPKISAAFDGASLDGVTFVLDDWGGGTMLEAQVPTIAAGQKVVDLMKAKASPTIAKVVCHAPKITGTVTF